MFEIDGRPPFRIATCDLDRAARFWRSALGLKTRARGLNRVDLVDDGDYVRVIIRRAPPPHRQHPCIKISAYDAQDVTAVADRFVALGASYPESPYPSRPDCAVVYDPDGYTVQIHARVQAMDT